MALVNELPPDWNSYDAAQKIAWFNANEVSVNDLQNAGVDNASINWMLNNGYEPPPQRDYEAERIAAEQEAARIAAEREAILQENIRQQEILREQEEQARIDEYYRQEAARQEAIRQEQVRAQQLAAQQEAARQEAARIALEQQASRDKAASVGVNLPSNWFDIGAQDRVNWLVDNKVTESQLRAYGTSQAEIDAIKPYGYYDVPAKLAADQEAARLEAARVEAARVAAETEALKNKLLAGNPDGDELTRRVVIEAVNNKWTPQQTLDFVNTQFGVNKTMADYERAVSNFFAPAVSNLLANGATEADIRRLGADQGIIPAVIDAAVRNNIGQIAKNDLANAVKDFFTTEKRTEGGVEKTYISPDFAKLIDYATTNKLSYADVAAAFSSGRPEFGSINITNDLVYEKDRQQFNALLKDAPDPKDSTKTIKTVSYSDALKAAITQGISLENLARFFDQTPDKFKTNISSNLASFADSLRASGVNPEAGLSDLLGIDPAETKAKLKTFDTDKAITGSLKQKEAGGLTYNEILDEIEASGMTIDEFVNRYFGQNKTDLITGLKSESKFTPEQRDLRDDYNAFASGFNKDNPLTYAKISDYLANKQLTDAQASSLFGISADDLAGYRTDTRLTNRLNEEKADDGKLSLSEILGVIDESKMDINTFVEKYFGKDRSALATSLTAEKKFTPEQRALRETYSDYIAGFGDKKPTLADVASFVDQNKLTDAQAESVLGVPARDLGNYRRDTFITSGLNALEQSDNRLDYTEIVTFAKDNNIPFSEMAKYLATPEKQDSLVRTLEDTQTDMNRTPAERLEFQLNQITSGGTKSGTWDKNSGWEHHADKMTDYLTSLGIKDLTQIGTRVETRDIYSGNVATEKDDFRATEGDQATNYVVYFDKTTGKELQAVPQSVNGGMWRFGSEGEGSGSTGYFLAPSQGGVGVTSNWEEKYGAKEYAMPLAIVAAIAAPYLLPELIGGVVGGVELAALGGEAIAGTGLTGTLMSAGIPSSIAPYAAQIVVNGVYNGTLSEASGGDFGKGFISGGVAPVLGQIASNAVNSALANLNLPPGVDKAVGNAVTQLVAKGDIDPLQVFTAGVSPTVSKALQDATGLNSAQTKLVLDTVLSQGKNLQALMNPQTALNFVMQNKGVFDGLGLDAASGATNIQTGQAVDLGAFNEDQVRVLQGQDTVSAIGPDTLPGAGIDTVIGAGQDTVSPAVLDTIPGATGLDTAPSIKTPDVIDEFLGYDSAIRAAEAIASGATQFEGVEAAQRFNEARAAGALDYQGYELAKLENALIENQKTFGNAFAVARDLYGPNATFNYGGKLYSTATFQERPDLGITPVEGSGRGTASGKTAEQEALLNEAAQQLQATAEKTPANTGIWEAAKTWVQNQLKLSSQEAEKYLRDNPNSPFTQSVSEAREAAGELIKNVVGGTALMFDNKPLAKAFIEGGEDLIRSGQAIGTGPQDTKNFSDTIELMRAAPSVADKAGIMFGRMLDGTSGFSRQTMIELRQEWPAFFLGGVGVKTAMIASGVIDTLDTAGNAAIEAYDGAIKQGKTDAEALTVARQAGLAAGGTEAAVQLTLGKIADFGVNKLDNVFAKAGARTGAEYLTEGAQEGLGSAATDYVVKGAVDLNEAITKGLIGAQIGGQLSGVTSPLAISQDMANRPIVSVDAQVISVDPQNKLALVQTQGGAELIDTSNLGDVKQGQSLQVSIPAPVTPIDVGKPDIAFTEIPVNGTNSTLVTLSPSQYLPDEDRVIALVDIGNGTTQPFYISTGLGGKVETEPGKWYPFFGIGSDGWFNKTTGKDQANYYNSSLLRDIAQTLDATIGDVRAQSRTYPVIKVSDTGPISFINKDMSPLSYTGAALDAQKFYGNIAGNLIRLENSAAGLEASLITAIEDGTIKDVKQIQIKLDSLNIPADTKASLLLTGSQLLGGNQVQDAASDLNAGAVVPSSGQPVAKEGAGAITGGPTVITGGPSVTTGGTIATDAAQAAVNAANTANTNAQAATGTANVLAGTGAVDTSVVNNAAQQASTAATNATQNATTATQAAATGDTTAAVNASINAVQNANVTQNITTDLASTFKPKEEFEEPKPVVTTINPTVTPPATVTPTVPPITVTPPPTVTPPVTPTETPPPTVEPPAVGPTPTSPTTSPTSPTSPTTSVKPPGPALPPPFFPIRVGQDGMQYIDYGYPDVPPPQLPPYTPFGAPNYLRPLDPYLGYGLGALMGGLYAQEPGNGGNQSLQNAQAQTAPAPR